MFGRLKAGRWLARIMSTALVGVGLSVGGLAIATPASANYFIGCQYGQCWENVGVVGRDTRCAASPYMGCLYWYGDRSTSGAYWGLSGYNGAGLPDLGTVRFLSGTGTGAGVAVRNNAAGIACEPYAGVCDSFISPNYAGDADQLMGGYVGTLYYSWNNEASFEIW